MLEKVLDLHVITDRIVRDSIQAMESVPNKKYVGGGIAVQSYTPEDLHRETVDLDYMLGERYGSQAGFKCRVKNFFRTMEEQGYNVRFKKRHSTYQLEITGDAGDTLLVQCPRRTAKNYERMQKIIQRELDHARDREIVSVKFKALSPEDLILRKMLRMLSFQEQYGVRPSTRTQSLSSFLQHVREEREEAFKRFDSLEPAEVAQLRVYADLFDVWALMSCAEPDESYLREGLGYWEYLKEKESEFWHLLESIGNK